MHESRFLANQKAIKKTSYYVHTTCLNHARRVKAAFLLHQQQHPRKTPAPTSGGTTHLVSPGTERFHDSEVIALALREPLPCLVRPSLLSERSLERCLVALPYDFSRDTAVVVCWLGKRTSCWSTSGRVGPSQPRPQERRRGGFTHRNLIKPSCIRRETTVWLSRVAAP